MTFLYLKKIHNAFQQIYILKKKKKIHKTAIEIAARQMPSSFKCQVASLIIGQYINTRSSQCLTCHVSHAENTQVCKRVITCGQSNNQPANQQTTNKSTTMPTTRGSFGAMGAVSPLSPRKTQRWQRLQCNQHS